MFSFVLTDEEDDEFGEFGILHFSCCFWTRIYGGTDLQLFIVNRF